MFNTSFITTVALFLSVFEYFEYSYLVECLFYSLNVGNLNINTFDMIFYYIYIIYTYITLKSVLIFFYLVLHWILIF